jgi:hypothetical protein
VREWKEGDKVVYELSTGTVGPGGEFHGGGGITSGNLAPRFREATPMNAAITEQFAGLYKELYNLSGNAGFNYPTIHSYFSDLARVAIDDHDSWHACVARARWFVEEARAISTLTVAGFPLFRPR